jgi:multicomponent Na+:H+ antiporter subunit D
MPGLRQDLVTLPVAGLDLVLFRIDTLNMIFAIAFLLAAFLHALYTLHEDDRVHDGMSLAYAGSAVAGVLAGDLITLFVCWELSALTSVFLIWRSGTAGAYAAGMRYLGFQILSGLFLLAGIVMLRHATGDISLKAFTSLHEPGALLVLAGLGIKAGFPLVHTWLQDAYPKATPGGAFLMSALTTKLAVYALARLFPGLDILVWIGAVMTVYPVFFAVVENDLRKVLAFSTNNQIGFMVCAIGIGTPLALNGAVAHAFAHVFFKGLLFMSMGAVLYRTGTAKATELGGLHKSMPFTALFCLIGALSISAVPLLSGFVAKSLTLSAAGEAGVTDPSQVIIWLMLLFASAGVLEHSGIKIPYFAFFAHDSGKRVQEAPFNMLLAMGMAAFICILAGLPALIPGFSYEWLYSFLPAQEEALAYHPYKASHVLSQLQLLMLALLAFILLKRFGLYPAEKNGVILDTDWFWRRAGKGLLLWVNALWSKVSTSAGKFSSIIGRRIVQEAERLIGPAGVLSRQTTASLAAAWSAFLLGAILAFAYFWGG